MSRLVYIRPWPRSKRGGLTRYPRVNLVAQQAPAESGRGRADGTSDRPRPDLAGRGAVDRILVCMQGWPVLLEGLTLVGIAVEYLMKWEGITLSKSSNWLLFKWAVSAFRHCRTALWNTTDYHAGTYSDSIFTLVLVKMKWSESGRAQKARRKRFSIHFWN